MNIVLVFFFFFNTKEFWKELIVNNKGSMICLEFCPTACIEEKYSCKLAALLSSELLRAGWAFSYLPP